MKKNRILHLGLLVLVLALVTTSLVSGTLAKYVTSVDGTGTVTVAKWAVKLGDQEVNATEDFVFDLFKTSWADPGVNGQLIAPGTSGSFDLTFDTSGTQVAHKVTIILSKAETGNDIGELDHFRFEGKPLGQEVYSKEFQTGTADAATINWVWPYETTNGDTLDTADGIAGKSYTIKATFTVTQLDNAAATTP